MADIKSSTPTHTQYFLIIILLLLVLVGLKMYEVIMKTIKSEDEKKRVKDHVDYREQHPVFTGQPMTQHDQIQQHDMNMNTMNTTNTKQDRRQHRAMTKEGFCGGCGSGSGSLSPLNKDVVYDAKKMCPSCGSYQFVPCKCFGPQGGALNPPRPERSSGCSNAVSMSKEDMIKFQGGCLRNDFTFPSCEANGVQNILGVS